jgi:two-component sensor histidine kinase
LEVSVNKIYLIVGDNGIGIPESIDIKDTQTLGLQLVNTLVEQLNGKISLIRKTGTKFLIEFNI